jgi:hypothetical protein
VLQPMPRPIHHSKAQPIRTGMTISGRNAVKASRAT